jgi:hypothetical protein
MNEIEKLFGLDSEGKLNRNPLEPLGFRFDAKSKSWRTVTRFHSNLPKNISRNNVASAIGIDESLIEKWEKAVSFESREPNSITDTKSLLSVDHGAVLNLDPLSSWQLRYYPQSKTWRRTRSHRNEVTRAEVARKVGVPEELITLWEQAMNARWSSGADTTGS